MTQVRGVGVEQQAEAQRCAVNRWRRRQEQRYNDQTQDAEEHEVTDVRKQGLEAKPLCERPAPGRGRAGPSACTRTHTHTHTRTGKQERVEPAGYRRD